MDFLLFRVENFGRLVGNSATPVCSARAGPQSETYERVSSPLTLLLTGKQVTDQLGKLTCKLASDLSSFKKYGTVQELRSKSIDIDFSLVLVVVVSLCVDL